MFSIRHQQLDLLIVGAGGAGLTSAISAFDSSDGKINIAIVSKVFANPTKVSSIENLKLFLFNWYSQTYPILSFDCENSDTKINLTLNGIYDKILLHLNLNKI